MNPVNELNPRETAEVKSTAIPEQNAFIRWFAGIALVLVISFSVPLWRLIRYALHEETVSHVLLVPFICAYLLRIIGKRTLTSTTRSLVGAVVWAIAGIAALLASLAWGNGRLTLNDALTLSTFSFYCFLLAAALATLGWQNLRPYRFVVAFFIFMVPLPLFLTNALSVGLQYASAEAADVTLRLTGMPVFRDGLGFQLPGLRIFVAEECSGIRSTLVLFITSILAAHLFLATRWKKVVFILCVFPIGVLRNAIRITSISWLSVNVDSSIIDSAFHHRGGPIFFVLSLIPLFLLLWWFRKSDRKKATVLPAKN